MGWRFGQLVRRLTLVLVVAAGGAVMVVCGAGPLQPQSENGASACPDSWTSPVVEADTEAGSDDSDNAGSDVEEQRAGADGGAQRGTVVEDPTGHALDAFYESLAAVDRTREPGLLSRITCFGDSHTAADFMTGQLRRRMQKRFGDGGHGFIAAGKPWPSYRHRNIRNGSFGIWDGMRVRHGGRDDNDGRLGLAGVSVETDRQGASVWVATATEGPVGRKASRFELFYLSRPAGGRFRLHLDDDQVARLSARGPELAPAYHVIETEDGPHHFRVESMGRGVLRLFGIVVEREGPGVTVDSLGINGARITAMLAWDEEVFTQNLARRSPDLVVLWYGANSVGDDWYTLETYEQWVIDAVTRVRRAVPDASCLIVGPPDMGRATLADHGPRGTPAALAPMIAAQRDAANLLGCGFFDMYSAMGGADSNVRWSNAEPRLAGHDGIHFTSAGYERLANALYEALIDGYAQYSEGNPEG